MESSYSGNVVQLSCVYPPYRGGIGNVARDMHAWFPNIRTITPDYGNTPANADMRILRLEPIVKIGNAAIMKGLSSVLHTYDTVILHYPFFGALGPVLRWKKNNPNKKLIIWYHHDPVASDARKVIFDFTQAFIVPQLISVADAVICGSSDYARSSDLHYTDYAEKFVEIPFARDASFWNGNEHLDFESCKACIFVGTLDRAHDFKGLDMIVRAWKQMPESATLTVVGDGSDAETYKRSVCDRKNIIFAGNISDDELKALYASHRFLIVAAKHAAEAFSLTAMEAQLIGTPVIASDLPGVRTVTQDQSLLFKTGNQKALERTLKKALDMSAGEWMNISHVIKQKARMKFSKDAFMEKLSEILKK